MARHNARWNASKSFLLLANILIPVAVLIFATGFFPYKPFMPGLAEYEDLSFGEPPVGHFDKIIFMVVDALRSDFVYAHGSGFKFTQSLIRSGEALPYTAHATSPTITMPRVKAITTGSIPSFLDVILNFAESDTTSTLGSQDTWLAQIKDKKDGSLIMYGDDTWLKLFPNTFARADGTSSFFVSDFTEVDNNVTRHVPRELQNEDWNAMILHYLGLDHIGHKAGPLSPNMRPKQEEMDGMVQTIYGAMNSMDHLNSTLLVLCGDHGMNEGGNHGGSAPGETSPALVFMSPKLKSLSSGKPCPAEPRRDFEYYSMVEQSDIAPTLAALLGFPIPLNNLGVMISDFLPLWQNRADQLQLLLRNARQMLKIVQATFTDVTFADDTSSTRQDHQFSAAGAPAGLKLASLWSDALRRLPRGTTTESAAYEALEALYKFCKKAQEVMSSTASNYDVTRLYLGIGLTSISVLVALLATRGLPLRTSDTGFFAATTLLYSATMFSSSYVEEEHHFWYWITAGWIAYLSCVKATDKSMTNTTSYIFLVLVLHRISQRWNQTGQKFAGAPDIVHDILRPNPWLLWMLVALTYLVLIYRIRNQFAIDLRSGIPMGTTCALILCVPAFAFKLGFTANDAPELLLWLSKDGVEALSRFPLIGGARIVFVTFGVEALWACITASYAPEPKAAKRNLSPTLQTLLTLFMVTQARTTNIPLFLLSTIQLSFLGRLRLKPIQITTTCLLLGYSLFFALGNSNAISSIDLSNAYNGVSGYNVIAVGILVFVSNWAGPIWWSLAGVGMLINSSSPLSTEGKERRDWIAEVENLVPRERERNRREEQLERPSLFFTHLTLLTLSTTVGLLAVMLACALLRTHLFIWTVFSPKYLYAMAWSMGFHLVVNLALGSALWGFCIAMG